MEDGRQSDESRVSIAGELLYRVFLAASTQQSTTRLQADCATWWVEWAIELLEMRYSNYINRRVHTNINRVYYSPESSPTLYVNIPNPSLQRMLTHWNRKNSMKQSWYWTRVFRFVLTWCAFLQKFHAEFIQEVNVQNMNVELVAQMFKNYQSNVLFHLEG